MVAAQPREGVDHRDERREQQRADEDPDRPRRHDLAVDDELGGRDGRHRRPVVERRHRTQDAAAEGLQSRLRDARAGRRPALAGGGDEDGGDAVVVVDGTVFLDT